MMKMVLVIYRGTKSGAENYYKKISGQIQGAKNFNVLENERNNWRGFMHMWK